MHLIEFEKFLYIHVAQSFRVFLNNGIYWRHDFLIVVFLYIMKLFGFYVL